MSEIKRTGYGQVEPNHLSAQYTGQIYAQLPAMTVSGDTKTPIDQLENGQFLKYNYAKGVASVTGNGEWLLVYNEEKLYDERHLSHKDFCMKASEMADKTIYPRLLKTNVGDIYTTNTFTPAGTGYDQKVTGPTLVEGDFLTINAAGWLAKSASKPDDGMVFQVVKDYVMPDGQPGVKIQRIQ